MWYKVSDEAEKMAFYVDCDEKNALSFATKKSLETKRNFSIFLLDAKPENLVSSGCTRIESSEKNKFIEYFLFKNKK
ncbi:MAG: hypothetical protein PHH98_05200 [Candidatus Gracilibacteria bacterium]|nr:hypothetical protein [Candidatus Gracilibacteria bacterium]